MLLDWALSVTLRLWWLLSGWENILYFSSTVSTLTEAAIYRVINRPQHFKYQIFWKSVRRYLRRLTLFDVTHYKLRFYRQQLIGMHKLMSVCRQTLLFNSLLEEMRGKLAVFVDICIVRCFCRQTLIGMHKLSVCRYKYRQTLFN